LETAHRAAAAAGGSSAATPLPPFPAFVKPNIPRKSRKQPGRKAGHAAALRPMPSEIDQIVDVPLVTDARGRELCPVCRCALSDLKSHERLFSNFYDLVSRLKWTIPTARSRRTTRRSA
jgi:hypothetical protein